MKAKVEIEYKDPVHVLRVNEILSDGIITDSEGAELLLMKAKELPRFDEARTKARGRLTEPQKRKIVWSIIVGGTAAISTLIKILS